MSSKHEHFETCLAWNPAPNINQTLGSSQTICRVQYISGGAGILASTVSFISCMALFFCKNRSNNLFRHMPLLSYFNVRNANIIRFYINNKIVLLSSFPYNFHNFSGTPSLVILVFSSIRWRIHSYPTPQQPITTSQRIPLIPQQFEVVALKRLDSNSLVTDRGRCHQCRLLWSFFRW